MQGDGRPQRLPGDSLAAPCPEIRAREKDASIAVRWIKPATGFTPLREQDPQGGKSCSARPRGSVFRSTTAALSVARAARVKGYTRSRAIERDIHGIGGVDRVRSGGWRPSAVDFQWSPASSPG